MSYTVLLWKNKCWESQGSNLGDLAIIKSMVEKLRDQIPGVEVMMPSDDPEYTAKLYGIRSEKIGLGSIVRMVREADMILIGGGTVFTDVSSMTIIPVNTSVPLLGVLLGKSVATWGIGAGKKSVLGRLLVRLLLPHLKVVSVRDEETKLDLCEIYPPAASRIHVTEDAAFAYEVNTSELERENRVVIAPRRIFHYKNSILPFYLRKKLNLLPKGYYRKLDEFKDMLAAVADHAVEKHGSVISFLPMYSAIGGEIGVSGYLKSKFSSRDDIICQDIIDRMRHKDQASIFFSDSPEAVIKHLASSRAVMGCPLHSLMLSHLAETPFVGLSYQQKVSRFLRRVGMEDYIIHVEDISCPLVRDEFLGKLDRLLENEESLRETIREFGKDIQTRTNLPVKLLSEFIRTKV